MCLAFFFATVTAVSVTVIVIVQAGSSDVEAESRPSRVFYCVTMACASAFAAMAMTSWARTDGYGL